MNKKEALDAMKIGKKIMHPYLKKHRGIDWIAMINPNINTELKKQMTSEEWLTINAHHTIMFSNGDICNDSFFFSDMSGLPDSGYLIYYVNFKNDPLSYFMFMYNMWNEDVCLEVFHDANCGYKHLWDKWVELKMAYGNDGAIARYLCELSEDYAATLVKFALLKYDGRKRI